MSGTDPIRVVVVDDSATVRAVLKRLLGRATGIQVIGEAADGAGAVDVTLQRRPDVVLMDIEMPVVDGFAAIERIMALRPTPILVLTSCAAREQMRVAFETIRRGAVEVLPKPTDADEWEQLGRSLPGAIRTAAAARVAAIQPAAKAGPQVPERFVAAPGAAAPATAHGRPPWPAPAAPIRWVAVGASTGGPTAVRDLVDALPRGMAASVLVVQHIAAGFESTFSEWLAGELGRDVRLARDGERPAPGGIRVGPCGVHLLLAGDGTLRLDAALPPRQGHRPSADELFLSCAQSFASETAGVLLTGMGSDGAVGLGALRRAGGVTAVQDEASSVVFGMPRAALDAGAALVALPPRELGAALARHVLGGNA